MTGSDPRKKPVNLSTRESRRRLEVQHPPYWQHVARGLSVGYRKGETRSEWYVRRFIGGKYQVKALGAADDTAPADGLTVFNWQDAVQSALDPETAARPGKGTARTIGDVGKLYFQHRRPHTASPGSTDNDEGRFNTKVLPTFKDRSIADLGTDELQRWLDQLVTKSLAASKVSDARRAAKTETPVILSDEEARQRKRMAKVSANRTWNIFRAVLNYAFKKGLVTNDVAWRRIEVFKNVDQPRLKVLTVAEALRLLNVLDPHIAQLVRGALYTGLRLGELLALRPMDVRGGQIHVRHSKSGKSRHVPLSDEGVAFFDELAKSKEDKSILFAPLADNNAFRVRLTRAMRAACVAAEIDPPAVFHDLRRSYGSLLLNEGASMDQIQKALGHADARMTQRTYAHMTQEHLSMAIKSYLPSFKEGAPKPVKKPKARIKGVK